MPKMYRVRRVKVCGRDLWDLQVERRTADGSYWNVAGRIGESVATRAELRTLCDAANSADALLAALRELRQHVVHDPEGDLTRAEFDAMAARADAAIAAATGTADA